MKRRLIVLSCIVLLGALSSGLQAGPAKAKHIAADAKWYLHLDGEVFRGTEACTALKAEAAARFDLDGWLDRVKALTGVNPLTDINGITVYSSSFEEGTGAAIIYGKLDEASLLKLIAANPDYAKEKYGEYSIHIWKDDKGKPQAGCFYADGVAVMADKPANVKTALDVLDGKKPAGSALVKDPAAGTVLSGAATDVQKLAERPGAAWLANAKSMELSIGEKTGKVVAEWVVNAVSADRAALLRKVAEGFKALLLLDQKQPPEVRQLLDMIVINGEGNRVTAKLEGKVADVIGALKTLDALKKAGGKDPQ